MFLDELSMAKNKNNEAKDEKYLVITTCENEVISVDAVDDFRSGITLANLQLIKRNKDLDTAVSTMDEYYGFATEESPVAWCKVEGKSWNASVRKMPAITPKIMFQSVDRYPNEPMDAAELLAYEVIENNDPSILDGVYRLSPILRNDPIAEELENLRSAINNETVDKLYPSASDAIPFFQRVLDRIYATTGKKIKYALFLSVSDDVFRFHDDPDLFADLKAYRPGPFLIDIVCDVGFLYGYEEIPTPIATY